MTNTTWVDTGFLVSLFVSRDPKHKAATTFLQQNSDIELYSIVPVLTEACFFLDVAGKSALLEWVERGAVTICDIASRDLLAIRNVIQKYEDLQPDFTDAALVAMADVMNIAQILTVDVRDFSVYRLSNGESFTRLWV